MKKQGVSENSQSKSVKVFLRIRPFLQKEIDIGKKQLCLEMVSDSTVKATTNTQQAKANFSFDRVFGPQVTQQDIYGDVASQIVKSAFEGINGTIFCYGQTASGKTYTSIGSDISHPESNGLIPRVIEDTLARSAEMSQKEASLDIRVQISMVEIYNQKVKDLLNPKNCDMRLRQNQKKGTYIEGLTEKYVSNKETAYALLISGLTTRACANNTMNQVSSRSHVIFTLTIFQNDYASGMAKSGKIIITDLAGCEKISHTGATGMLLEEAKKINASLTSLGKVICLLSEPKPGHIPYRDSKLTRLLQESLGGNSRTHLIMNVSPSSMNDQETLSTLRFGQRAKNIKNKPTVNKEYTATELLVLLEKAEIQIKQQNKLIQQLKRKRRFGFCGLPELKPITLYIANPDSDDEASQSSMDSDVMFNPMDFVPSVNDQTFGNITDGLCDQDHQQMTTLKILSDKMQDDLARSTIGEIHCSCCKFNSNLSFSDDSTQCSADDFSSTSQISIQTDVPYIISQPRASQNSSSSRIQLFQNKLREFELNITTIENSMTSGSATPGGGAITTSLRRTASTLMKSKDKK